MFDFVLKGGSDELQFATQASASPLSPFHIQQVTIHPTSRV